ncbi:MAG: TraR/DksA family transcriptional regulator, partial [Nitrospinota bacterium]|nr:TraR/DksA family transcriptional regulator [Nitrospinota bacterium]
KKKAPAKKVTKSAKKTTAVKKKPSVSKKKAPAKKATKKTSTKKTVKKAKAQKKQVKNAVLKAATKKVPKVVAKKAAPKKTAPKKVVEPPEEIIKPSVKSPFKKDDPRILKIQDRLIQDRKRLMGMLRSSKEVERTINDITFSNEIDLASSLEGREMAFQLSSRERNELRMVEEALFKIKGDTYGVCDSCSEYITLKRLEILPLTALCIACQENLEVR